MMNERILELAKQAERLAEDELAHLERVHNRLYSFTEGREIYNQKFAELIVRECVSTLNDMHLWQSVNNQNYPNSWHDAVDQGIDAIKSHFGVTE